VSSLQQWLAARALDGVDLTGVHRLLDVGCGDGRVTASLVDRIPDGEGVGIDPSPRMIAVAPSSRWLEFRVGSAETMSFRDEFDLVVSFNALHWVKEQFSALEAIAAALRRGGRATLVFVCDGPQPSLEDVAMTVTASPTWSDHFAAFTPPFVHPDPVAWQREATVAGFVAKSVRVDDLEWDFGTREAFTAWCAVGFGGWTGGLSSEDAERFVSDVVDAYAAARGSDHVFRFRQLVANLTRR
jgi:trans-aconitate 2-methyltransferase